MGASPNRRSAGKRERLLDVGVELLDELPIEEITINLIAERASMARGLIFYYYGDKDALMRAVIHKFQDAHRAEFLVNELGAFEDPNVWLRAEVGAFLNLVLAHPRAMNTILGFIRAGGGVTPPDMEAFRDFSLERVRAAFHLPSGAPLVDATLHSWLYLCVDLVHRLQHAEDWNPDVVGDLLAAQLRSALDVLRRAVSRAAT